MTTFTNKNGFRISILNQCKSSNVAYDFSDLKTQGNIQYPTNLQGSLSPGQEVACGLTTSGGGTLEIGNASLVSVNGVQISLRFWSGSGDQYVNFLPIQGFATEQDTKDINQLAGNGLRITVDGHGVNNPTTQDIYLQIADSN